MSNHAFDDPGGDPSAGQESGGRSRRRVAMSPQIIAAALLVLALIAIAWLFLADSGTEPVPGLSTATAQVVGTKAVAVATRTGTAGAALAAAATPGLAGLGTATAGVAAAGQAGVSGIAEGSFVQVQGTGTYGLRLRYGPGADNATIRIVSEGETFKVLGGPEAGGPDTFWRVQDVYGNVGWATQEYLVPVAAPANWSAPAASPTFDVASAAGAGGAATATP